MVGKNGFRGHKCEHHQEFPNPNYPCFDCACECVKAQDQRIAALEAARDEWIVNGNEKARREGARSALRDVLVAIREEPRTEELLALVQAWHDAALGEEVDDDS